MMECLTYTSHITSTETTNVPVSICPKCPDGIVNTSDGDTLSDYSTLPSLPINYADNVSHLTNLDVDLTMPVDINFSYYIPYMTFTAILIFFIVYQVTICFLF